MLFDNHGVTFAVYRAPSARAAPPQMPLPPGVYRDSARLIIYQPVINSDRQQGTLFIRWDLSPWYAETRIYTVAALGVLAASLALAAVVGRVL